MTNQAAWPSAEQIESIKKFAIVHGRNWKSKLRQSWFDGNYEGIDPYGNDAAYLQQLRNNMGPSWLNKFRLDEDQTTGCTMWSVQESNDAN